MWPRDIINYWAFLSKVSGNCHKMIVGKTVQMTQETKSICAIISTRPRGLLSLFCCNYFPLLFDNLQFFFEKMPSPNSLALLEVFRQAKFSAVSGATKSKKSPPTRFAVGMTNFAAKELLLSAKFLQVHRNFFHAVDQYIYTVESVAVFWTKVFEGLFP